MQLGNFAKKLTEHQIAYPVIKILHRRELKPLLHAGCFKWKLKFKIRLHSNNVYACVEFAFHMMPGLGISVVDTRVVNPDIGVGEIE